MKKMTWMTHKSYKQTTKLKVTRTEKHETNMWFKKNGTN